MEWTKGSLEHGLVIRAREGRPEAISSKLRIILDGTREDKAFSRSVAFSVETLSNPAFGVKY